VRVLEGKVWFSQALDRPELEPAKGEGDDAAEKRLLQKHGEAHERRTIDKLKAAGRDVVEIPQDHGRLEAIRLTLEAMREGRGVICQASLEREPFAGVADFLVRAERPSKLRAWSYDVSDAKLARSAKPYFLIQLGCYASMLEAVQGEPPRTLGVVLGTGDTETFRTDDHRFYYASVERAFLEFMQKFAEGARPLPEPGADHRRWKEEAERVLADADHLSLVAGLSKSQIPRLGEVGITTLSALAESDVTHVAGIGDAALARIVEQARMQRDSRGEDRPVYSVVPSDEDEPRTGLATLPPPGDLDVFLDLEGNPLVDGGLEYLWGAAYREEEGEPAYSDWWGHDAAGEKRALEGFIDWACDRWKRDPQMHIYHYAPYEVSAITNLMGRYGTRENEVDDLLRNHVFVDLYRVVRSGVRVGTQSYSLKKIEQLYRDGRDTEVTSGMDSVVRYETWTESEEPRDWRESPILESIREYNKDDCVSTLQLYDWLRERQLESGIEFLAEEEEHELAKPPGPKLLERQQLAEELLAEIPETEDDRKADADRWRVQELLAQLLEFHRREKKPYWWTWFHRRDMTEQERIEDHDCLGGLQRTEKEAGSDGNAALLEYTYQAGQETKLRSGSSCAVAQTGKGTKIHQLDEKARLVTLRIGSRTAHPDERICLIPKDDYPTDPLARSIMDLVQAWRAHPDSIPSALVDFILRRRPRIKGHPGGRLTEKGEEQQDAVVRLVSALDDSTLCIQGPPGSGKTTAAAAAIVALIRDGKSVGVTSNGHKAILNLMQACGKQAGNKLPCVKIGGDDVQEDPFFDECTGAEWVKSGKPDDLLEHYKLLGGTVWAFSNVENALDYLFVDEASQVSLANLVAMARSTRNIVLLGDQMQLSQPIQGSHPGESGRSTLDYFLGEHPTVPDNLGIFLARTWRLHPGICDFVSGAVYEDRLQPGPDNATRVIPVPDTGAELVRRESGIIWLPVKHEGNRQDSPEEVDVIRRVVAELLDRDAPFKRGDREGPLTLADILVVAPYNLQVQQLQAALDPGLRVGTVDKFQHPVDSDSCSTATA